jgi:hypothetical protein
MASVSGVQLVFLLTVAGVAACFTRASDRPAYTAAVIATWLVFSAVLAGSGWVGEFDARPPHFFLFVAPTLVATIALAFSPLVTRLLPRIGWAGLVGFQVFRVPVEWVLFELHRDGMAPVQMTFEGWNFDVLTGLSAPIAAWLAARGAIGRRGLLAWNCAGLALLANIVTIAVLSTPTPLRAFWNEPANTFVAHWPWVWLPGFLVPAALCGHLVAFRKLARMR